MEKMKNVLILPPLGYLDFLVLMKNCSLIITDSGGVQEEATAPGIRKRVLVVRLSTERQEAVEAGSFAIRKHQTCRLDHKYFNPPKLSHDEEASLFKVL